MEASGQERYIASTFCDRAAGRVAAVDWNAAQPAPRPKKAWAAAAVLLGVTVILLFVPTGTIGGSARLDAAAFVREVLSTSPNDEGSRETAI